MLVLPDSREKSRLLGMTLAETKACLDEAWLVFNGNWTRDVSRLQTPLPGAICASPAYWMSSMQRHEEGVSDFRARSSQSHWQRFIAIVWMMIDCCKYHPQAVQAV